MITKENMFNCSQRGCYLMQFTLSDLCTFQLFFSSIFSVDYDSYTISLNYMGYIVMEEIITYFPFLISIYLLCLCMIVYVNAYIMTWIWGLLENGFLLLPCVFIVGYSGLFQNLYQLSYLFILLYTWTNTHNI